MNAVLVAERLRRGKSVVAMAQEIGVPAHVLRYAEKSGRRPSPENALKIANAYALDVLALWPFDSELDAA